MLPMTTRSYVFTPLNATENLEEWSGQEEIREDDTSRQPTAVQSFCRALIWTFCSAFSIYSTKELMTTYAYHYPLIIAFRTFASILVVYTILIRLRREFSKTPSNTPGARAWKWTLSKPGRDGLLSGKHSLLMLPASIGAAASLPMLLEGLLHMPSLPVIVMLFPLVNSTESLVLFFFCSDRLRGLPWETFLVMAASAVILFNEYRLMVQGLIWGVAGILLIGVSRAFFIIGSQNMGSDFDVQSRPKAYHTFVILTLTFGVWISGVLMVWFEMAHFSPSQSTKTTVYSFFNIACFICTAFSGSSILAYTPLSFEVPKPQFSDIPTQNLEFVSSFASSLLILFLSVYLNPVIVSWAQLAGYLTAAACLVGFERIHNSIFTCLGTTYSQVYKSPHTSNSELRKVSRLLTSFVLLLAILFSSWTISTLSTASINALTSNLPSKLDKFYHPTTRFEIVISMYDESPSDIHTLFSALKSTTLLSTLTPTVTLYTKNPTHAVPSLQSKLKAQTGADRVEHLENRGREGGTYLHHIVNHWDELAEQTMFIQAHAHNIRELIPRINSYLVADSGFLSLGFAGVSCRCGRCGDRWGWEDKAGVVPGLYERIYGVPCEDETPILLTYKGQFVASARRLRGIPKAIYEDLLKTITSNSTSAGEVGSKEKDPEGGVVGEDTPENPHFGFAMERIWGLLGQCATDQRVAVKCPSLLSGMSRGGEAGDCGCLDTN
ncbi:hypothetical protein N431DRAFT_553678 [Stipitochalara longipes BDJ]|nr:hypothetical protein N431DRAFT_553678 [Stipitochalara longipes BDJ]